MKVIKNLNGSFRPGRATAIALGTFDGVHLGHQQVIQTMLNTAKAMDYDASVFTFSNLPKLFNRLVSKEIQTMTSGALSSSSLGGLGSQEERILSIDDKIELFETLGVENLWIVPFNEAIQQMPREQFLTFLCSELKMAHLTVGYNFKFGAGGAGDVAWLMSVHKSYGFTCHVVGAISDDTGAVSSTRIRSHLRDGDILGANALLGRHHWVSGVVHPGKQLGRTIGFPTANLKISPNMTLIKSGVYVTETQVGDAFFLSVTNVGYNPTFEQEEFNLETYILDFNQTLYHQRIKVYFRARIRDELKFSGIDELKEWIEKDVLETRKYFEVHPIQRHHSVI